MNAIKAKYDRKTKTYGVLEVCGADPLYAHRGQLVYDDAARVAAGIERGDLLDHWRPEHRAAVLAHLKALVAEQAA